jgi:hypothetical protein
MDVQPFGVSVPRAFKIADFKGTWIEKSCNGNTGGYERPY